MHLSTTAFDGVPYYVDIKEVAYAYLSLNHPEEALRAVSQYAEQCRYAANEIATHADYYWYENEKAVARWDKASQEALSFKEAISSGGRDLFEAEMAQSALFSAAVGPGNVSMHVFAILLLQQLPCVILRKENSANRNLQMHRGAERWSIKDIMKSWAASLIS